MDKKVEQYKIIVHSEVLVEIDASTTTKGALEKIREKFPFVDNFWEAAKHIAVEKVRDEDEAYPVIFPEDTINYEVEVLDTWSSVESIETRVNSRLGMEDGSSEIYWPLSQTCMDCQFGELDLSSNIDMVYLCSKGKSPDVSGRCNEKEEVEDDDTES